MWVAWFRISIWARRRRHLWRWPGWHPVWRCRLRWRPLRRRCLGPTGLSPWLMERVPLVAPQGWLPGMTVAGLLLVTRGPHPVRGGRTRSEGSGTMLRTPSHLSPALRSHRRRRRCAPERARLPLRCTRPWSREQWSGGRGVVGPAGHMCLRGVGICPTVPRPMFGNPASDCSLRWTFLVSRSAGWGYYLLCCPALGFAWGLDGGRVAGPFLGDWGVGGVRGPGSYG